MDANVAKAVDRLDRQYTLNGISLSHCSEWQTIRARLVELEAENERLNRELVVTRNCCRNVANEFAKHRDRAEKADALLRECDEVARKRGDKYGLCDAIDNTGQPYQSQFLAGHLAHLSENGHE